jgi:uncharacterized protein
MSIPREIQGQKYISLATFRRNGAAVRTPVWFGDDGNKLYVTTPSDSGKFKRLANNPRVEVAACNVRGKITGPAFAGTARVLPNEEWPRARKIIAGKYWMMRISSWLGLSNKKSAFLEVEVLPKAA